MIVLGIDTSGDACACAVLDGATAPPRSSARSEAIGRGHDGRLPAMVDEALGALDLPLDAITTIAVVHGPGAFTGLRIGLAFAGGLALARGTGLHGITGFEALRETIRDAARADGADRPHAVLVTAIDGRRGLPVVQAFDAEGAPVSPPSDEPTRPWLAGVVDRLGPGGTLAVCGGGAAAVRAWIEENGRDLGAIEIETVGDGTIDPRAVCRCALAATGVPGADPPAPLYLRAADAAPAPRPRGIVGHGP